MNKPQQKRNFSFDPLGFAQNFGYTTERIIGSDTFYHCPEHIQSIRAWMDKESL